MEVIIVRSHMIVCELFIQVSEHGSHHSSHMLVLGLSSKPSFYAFMCQDDLFNDCSAVVAMSRFLRQLEGPYVYALIPKLSSQDPRNEAYCVYQVTN